MRRLGDAKYCVWAEGVHCCWHNGRSWRGPGRQGSSKLKRVLCAHIAHLSFQAYVFELVEVVPDPRFPVKRWYKLKLRARDESKGPVTAVCGINGYLVSSMGQKVCCSNSL